MGEKAKEAATTATKLIDKLPADKREIAARLAETHAAGLAAGTELDLSGSVAIERKMDLDELCGCFCRSRDRFEREFIRAKNADAKLYLLIENGTWEKAYAGKYRSRMQPKAFVASLTAWLARYNCQIIFCEPATTGKLIREVLYRELKERLEVMECPQAITDS